MRNNRRNETLERYIYIAILCAQGVIIGLIERSIPSPFVFAPGAKIGLANIITLLSIFTLKFKDCFALVMIRLVLTTLIGGTVSTFMYAFSGALLSFFSMYLVKTLHPKYVSFIGISAVGGIMHNVGQLITASLIAQSFSVMLYLPVLAFMGILAGIAVGIVVNYLLTHVRALHLISEKLY